MTHRAPAALCPLLRTLSRRLAHFCAVSLSGREPSSSVSLRPGPSPESAQGGVRALHSQRSGFCPFAYSSRPPFLCFCAEPHPPPGSSVGQCLLLSPASTPCASSFHLPVLSRGSRPEGHCLALQEEPAQQVTAGSADKGPTPGPMWSPCLENSQAHCRGEGALGRAVQAWQGD